MKYNRSVLVSFCLSILLFISGCTILRNITKSDPFFIDLVDKSFCTKAHLHMNQWGPNRVHFHEVEEFSLVTYRHYQRIVPHEKIDDYMKFVAEPYNFFKNVPVPKGTKLTVKKVLFYDAITNSRVLIMSEVNDQRIATKLVDITSLFDMNKPYRLRNDIAELCESK